jgi:hypothetical protein
MKVVQEEYFISRPRRSETVETLGQARLMVFSLTGTISLVQPRQKFDSLPCFLFVVFGFELKRRRLVGSRVPLPTIFSRPFQYVEVFGRAASSHVRASHGHPCSRSHCMSPMLPRIAAFDIVTLFHGHFFVRAHWITSLFPANAASLHVRSSQKRPGIGTVL